MKQAKNGGIATNDGFISRARRYFTDLPNRTNEYFVDLGKRRPWLKKAWVIVTHPTIMRVYALASATAVTILTGGTVPSIIILTVCFAGSLVGIYRKGKQLYNAEKAAQQKAILDKIIKVTGELQKSQEQKLETELIDSLTTKAMERNPEIDPQTMRERIEKQLAKNQQDKNRLTEKLLIDKHANNPLSPFTADPDNIHQKVKKKKSLLYKAFKDVTLESSVPILTYAFNGNLPGVCLYAVMLFKNIYTQRAARIGASNKKVEIHNANNAACKEYWVRDFDNKSDVLMRRYIYLKLLKENGVAPTAADIEQDEEMRVFLHEQKPTKDYTLQKASKSRGVYYSAVPWGAKELDEIYAEVDDALKPAQKFSPQLDHCANMEGALVDNVVQEMRKATGVAPNTTALPVATEDLAEIENRIIEASLPLNVAKKLLREAAAAVTLPRSQIQQADPKAPSRVAVQGNSRAIPSSPAPIRGN